MQKGITYLDEEVLMENLEKIENKYQGKNLLLDLVDIDDEVLQFFEDLINSSNSDELMKYSSRLMENGMELILSSVHVLNTLAQMLDNDTILSNTNTLISNVASRRRVSRRRLL